MSHYRLQLYNKRPQHGLFSANFEKLLRFLPEHPPQILLFLFDDYETITLKKVAVFLLFH